MHIAMSGLYEFTRYQMRPIEFLGVRGMGRARMKLYSIVHDASGFEPGPFEEGLRMAVNDVLQPNPARGTPGVGFIILHRGRFAKYLVVCCWSLENELPTRVYVEDERGWRTARPSEGVCVWDLQILWFERCAYVETILGGRTDGVNEYLARYLRVRAPGDRSRAASETRDAAAQ